jgi:hypothetical protein
LSERRKKCVSFMCCVGSKAERHIEETEREERDERD